MLKDVTFGQYYPADSFIHKMDARIKLVLCMLYMVGIFFVTSFVGFAFITKRHNIFAFVYRCVKYLF